MRCLITGGAGFIGYHVSKALLERGDSVVIVDNFNDYYEVSLKRARADELSKFDNVKIIELDISEYDALLEVFKNNSFDVVCNLAAQAGVRYSLENPFVYLKSNIDGFLNILELCRKFNVKNLVYASSSSVYGECTDYPLNEIFQLDKPISLYAATKKSNELMAYNYHHLFGINCIGLRFFTVYGPYGRPDMALFKFVKNILESKPIDVYNNGDMKRDFTYISDIVAGVLASIDNPQPYEIFNLGRGEPQNLLDFISCIEDNLGIKAEKNMMPMQPGDVKETFADTSKAEKLLNYKPKVSIQEGVRKTIEWFKEYYDIK
ncbi:GDP-mannose 4,6-dehydratase [Candidatus Woesearchaeota archaeon]|nr:GDP-mannose 4,6-dehydratase [Candidatus Woesearchaeota archaeon]